MNENEQHSLTDLQKAGLALKKLKSKYDQLESRLKEPIAVVSMACRFPGNATDIWKYWNNLCDGVDSVTTIASDRWDVESYYNPVPGTPGKMYTKCGGFIDNIDAFDPQFFGISHHEAPSMDPQHRLLLETAYEALEGAGEVIDRNVGANIGVFIGITGGDYGIRIRQTNKVEHYDGYYLAGNPLNASAGRISYTFGFHGPAIAIDTACSSSLVAIHCACGAIRNGECDSAIVGGVNLILSPENTAILCRTGMVSLSGKCKTFSDDADGMIRGEGCAAIFLKPLSKAITDNNTIFAVIRGTAVNQDGASSSFTAPNGTAQEMVIKSALEKSGIEASTVDFIETHGSATALGDSIELRSLQQTYGKTRKDNQPLYIGSVKTNIGHLEAAAGIAGFIKAVLVIKNGIIPKHLNLTRKTSKVSWENQPLVIPAETTSFPSSAHLRRAAISSFGASGTNAHVIIESFTEQSLLENKLNGDEIICWSYETKEAGEIIRKQITDLLKGANETFFKNMAFTLQTGRKRLRYRSYITGKTVQDALLKINSDSDVNEKEMSTKEIPSIVFAIPSLFCIPENCLDNLLNCDPIVNDLIEHNTEFLTIRELLTKFRDELQNTENYQLCKNYIYVILIYKFFRILGIEPAIIAGENISEWVAAAISGAIEYQVLYDLLKTISSNFFESHSSVHQVSEENIKNTFEKLSSIFSKGEFYIPVQSAVNGQRLSVNQFVNYDYQKTLLNQTNAFDSTVEKLYERGNKLIISIGAFSLSDDVTRPSRFIMVDASNYNSSLLKESLAKLWQVGIDVQWKKLYENDVRKIIPLPTYPFNRKKYWIDLNGQVNVNNATSIKVKMPIEKWLYTPVWKQKGINIGDYQNTLNDELIIVFAEKNEFCNTIISCLAEKSEKIILVYKGEIFKESGINEFTINSKSYDDYISLIEAVKQIGRYPDRIIHLWNISFEKTKNRELLINDYLDNGFFSVLYTAQALSHSGDAEECKLFVLMNNTFNIYEKEILYPEKAPVYSALRVIGQESENIRCIGIDLDFPIEREITSSLKETLFTLLGICSESETFAIRGSSVYIMGFDPISIDGLKKEEYCRVRQGGNYLITGGLGGIGLALAEFLSSRFKANCILTSRTEFPNEKDWENIISDVNINNRGMKEKLIRIKKMKSNGSKILILKADVSNYEEMKGVSKNVKRILGQLNGIFHVAGIPGGGLFSVKKADACVDVFKSKIHGTLIIHKVFKEQLDFTVYFSSMISVLGGLGQVDYCAANSFLDNFAFFRSAFLKKPTFSINWDMWQWDAWQESFLKEYPEVLNRIKKERKEFGISFEEGMSIVQQVLSMNTIQVCVSTKLISFAFEDNSKDKIAEWKNLLQKKSIGHERPVLSSEYNAPITEMEKKMVEIWQNLTGFDKIGINDDFFELGGDSLLGMQLVEKIKDHFDVKISIHQVFDSPTITELCLYIEEKMLEEIESMTNEEAKMSL